MIIGEEVEIKKLIEREIHKPEYYLHLFKQFNKASLGNEIGLLNKLDKIIWNSNLHKRCSFYNKAFYKYY
jgi:hypothetical protein